MKRSLAVIALRVFCAPLFAQDQRTIKRDLIQDGTFIQYPSVSKKEQ